jgi:hypothetical protein
MERGLEPLQLQLPEFFLRHGLIPGVPDAMMFGTYLYQLTASISMPTGKKSRSF